MEFVIGTAQLGMKYGAANITGQPDLHQSFAIVESALVKGIRKFDCARSYGEAERRLGQALAHIPSGTRAEVITKLDATAQTAAEAEASISLSMKELGTGHLPVVLLHRWRQRRVPGVWETLRSHLDAGRIGKLGVSVGDLEEALEALADPEIQHIQIPFNLLDWRWRHSRWMRGVSARPGVVIHARSIFLQGILVNEAKFWPKLEGIDPSYWLERLDHIGAGFGARDRAELCMRYAKAHGWLSGLVVGIDTPAQLEENWRLFSLPPLEPAGVAALDSLPVAPVQLLNPALWPRP